jgi:NAD(P)H dehydrogenase (quinone)
MTRQLISRRPSLAGRMGWMLSVALMALGAAGVAPQSRAQQAQGATGDRIIVSGASGNLGELTVRALLERGVPASRLILVSRTPDELAEYAAMGASTRFGDFTKPESLPAAYAGGKRMLLVSIGGGALPAPRPELHKRAIDAAIAAGVELIAYTSWAAISQGDVAGISSDHVATEEILMESGVAWTMLRNSVYMDGVPDQARQIIAAGRAVIPPNDVAMSYVTRADCAAAAAAVLATPGHENKIYDITGPASIGTREIAEAAAAASGKEIEIVEGGAGGRGGLGLAALNFVSDDFETLTGRSPTSIRELLEGGAAP